MSNAPSIVVIGSVNLDLVATVARLPTAGETVSGAELGRYPGGKGANQALAARRLGANVRLCACTGDDAEASQALRLLRADGVDLSGCHVDRDAATGVALIAVAPDGENQIVVAPGANRRLLPENIDLPDTDALICQLEVPIGTIAAVARHFDGFFCVNLAPAARVPHDVLRRADLVVMNETEARFIGEEISVCDNLVAVSLGARGALMKRGGVVIAEASSKPVNAIDTTGAGDTFTAALTVGLLEGMTPVAALSFACAAGALATTRPGAQPALPWRDEVDELMAESG